MCSYDAMSNVVSSIVAVLGTLAGSAMAYVFAERSRRRNRRESRHEGSRRERLDAYSGFYSALTDYRRAQYDRWQYWHSDAYQQSSPLEQLQALDGVYRQRVATHAAMARLCLTARLGLDDAVVVAARAAFEKADEMIKADNQADVEKLGNLARSEANAFLTTAADSVHET